MDGSTTNRRRFMGGIAAGTIGGAGVGGDLFVHAGPTGDDVFGPVPGSGAVDAFLRLSGVEGESRDRDHKDEIDILAWSFGVDGASGGATGRSAGRPTFGDLQVAKHVDRATPDLFQACASGKHHEEAVITVRRSEAEATLEYFVITLRDVQVANYLVGVTTEEGSVEHVALNYAHIEVVCTAQGPNGSAGEPISRGWDVQMKAPC